jgi:triosephosphate isomerase (TIM)
MRTPFFVGNWKMNKTGSELLAFLSSFVEKVKTEGVEVGLAPQSVYLGTAVEKLRATPIAVVAQNCGQAPNGAYTGENSPVALKDLGVKYVILGHSERRWIYHEDNNMVLARMVAAIAAGLNVILCVGERLVERKEGRTFLVLEEQLQIIDKAMASSLHRITIAYEPVWAIGTGETATPEQAQEAHAFIRQWFHDRFSESAAQGMRVLYGGSAKAENASDLMWQNDVDGLLVGGASLDPLGFAELVRNGVRSSP